MSLYLKYRPDNFDHVIGHKNIINSIESLLKSLDMPHAFLFAGPSGTGKTTIARIMAAELRADPSDIIEFNIANTSGIDFIRQLNDTAFISPMMGDNKVFILDEVQQLSKEGQNCLLKLLEDSPKYAYFILCTTDSQRLLKPLRDRCQFYTLKLLSDNEIQQLISTVANLENILVPHDIMDLLVYKADGCPRKVLVSLDQIKDNTNNFDTCVNLLADELEAEEDIIDIIKGIIYKKHTWVDLMKMFNNLNTENETIRITFANYLSGCLKNAKSSSDAEKFSKLLELFLSGLTYGSGKAELIYILYKAFNL